MDQVAVAKVRLLDPLGFEHVVESGPQGLYGAENLAHFIDAPLHERLLHCRQIAAAAVLGKPLPHGYRRIE